MCVSFLFFPYSSLCIPKSLYLTLAQKWNQQPCLQTAMRPISTCDIIYLVYGAPILSSGLSTPLGSDIHRLLDHKFRFDLFTVITRQTHDLRGASGWRNQFNQLVNGAGLLLSILLLAACGYTFSQTAPP